MMLAEMPAMLGALWASKAESQAPLKWPPRNRLSRAASGAPLGGSAEGATGGVN